MGELNGHHVGPAQLFNLELASRDALHERELGSWIESGLQQVGDFGQHSPAGQAQRTGTVADLIHSILKCACLIDLRGRRFSASGVTGAGGAK